MRLSRRLLLRFISALLVGTAGMLCSGAVATLGAPLPQIETVDDAYGGADDLIRRGLEAAAGPADLPAGGERIHAERSVRRFYEGRQFAPTWTSEGRPTEALSQLLRAVRRADRHGLRPDDYHLTEIEDAVSRLNSESEPRSNRAHTVADLDLLATDAYLLLGSHLLGGRVDPETFEPNWIAQRRTRDLVTHLEEAIRAGSVRISLEALDPPQPEYGRLMRELERYREIAMAGGWSTVPSGPVLRPGEDDERVPILRKRLRTEGYDVPSAGSAPGPEIDPETGSEPDLAYGPELEEAVRNFQHRHGLDADGVVGPQTLQALNVTADARADQIALNMERWRWLPEELGSPHVLVNIAGFRLDVVEDGRSVMDMRVIVGRPYRTTPVFSDRISYLVFSPYWNVPHSIATQDILPQVKQNPAYLQEQNLRVLQGWGSDARPLDPASIDWSRLTAGHFPYRLRQEPGPSNALGTVKFMFPNRFNVYLHDTPARALFAQSVRTFSSGCIRIERPGDLAAYLLPEESGWTAEKIEAARIAGSEETVHLSDPVPVHLLYWTAWVDDADTIHFHRDVYGRDARLEVALRAQPPTVRTFP